MTSREILWDYSRSSKLALNGAAIDNALEVTVQFGVQYRTTPPPSVPCHLRLRLFPDNFYFASTGGIST